MAPYDFGQNNINLFNQNRTRGKIKSWEEHMKRKIEEIESKKKIEEERKTNNYLKDENDELGKP